MKKILILLLAAICAASILAGCGNKNGNAGNNKALEDAKDYAKNQVDKNIENDEDAEKAKEVIDSLNTDWATDKLPDGMPVYPDGEMFSFEADGNVTVQINGTNKKNFDDYTDKLGEAEWEVEEIVGMPDAFNLIKDSWNGTLVFNADNVTIMLAKTE